jgi:ABC-type nitrate/sulfonate/bicarbonate transport system permease component
MTAIDPSVALVEEAPQNWRRWTILGGRLCLALALLLGWEWGSVRLGSVFFAPPLEVARRLVEIARDGTLFTDLVATIRVSAFGFAIGCAGGILLPFLLRRSLRLTEAIEPYVMASQGIPKYALAPWLILWFGIGDTPKVVIVALTVFYIIFITTFAGIRAVDQRLINMARVVGAGEAVISREVIWNSLQPFFYAGLKVALPRAVSATIVGEFLVSTDGVGHYIEHARELSDTVGVFAGIIVATALVLAVNGTVEYLERRALAWRPVARDMEM